MQVVYIAFGCRVYREEATWQPDFVMDYLNMHKPYFTDIRFVNKEGGEPGYIKISPTMDKKDRKVWDFAKYELEGIWVMSHTLDSKTICERIGVKKINEKIAQGIKPW